MGTGVASLPSSLDCINLKDKIYYINNTDFFKYFFEKYYLILSKLDKSTLKNVFKLLVKSSID